jgi:GNAT superfamily N-acetyltransferase
MAQILITPCPVNAPEAQACMEAYFAELSLRFGQNFSPRPVDPDAQAMAPPRGLFLVARQDDRPVGCVGLRSSAEGIGPGCGEVKRLWVATEARGRGLARRLMSGIEAAARDMGLACLRLDTSRHLTEAQALYLRDGWQEIAAYNHNPHADHWFEKRLHP